jgi:GTPase SAR1 family protein
VCNNGLSVEEILESVMDEQYSVHRYLIICYPVRAEESSDNKDGWITSLTYFTIIECQGGLDAQVAVRVPERKLFIKLE